MTPPFQRPRNLPAYVTVEERSRVRNCRNCVFYDAPQGLCRVDATAVPTRTFCGRWIWQVNTNQTWISAFAPLEIQLADEADLQAELARSVAASENPEGHPAAVAAPLPQWHPDPFTPYEFGRHVPPGEEPFFEMLT